MKVLLHNRATGKYYAGQNQWVDDPEKAHDFLFEDRATEFVLQQKLADIRLVYYFGDPKFNLVRPIRIPPATQRA